MLAMAALLVVTVLGHSSNTPTYQLAGNASGGSGGAGGGAQSNVIYQCIVRDACPMSQSTQGGSGGAGGAATSSNNNSAANNTNSAAAKAQEKSPIKSVIARCILEIAGKTEVSAKSCGFERTTDNKILLSAPSVNGKYRYVVVWQPGTDGTAQGYLQGGKTNAVRALGLLKRDGACWSNTDVKVCAWK